MNKKTLMSAVLALACSGSASALMIVDGPYAGTDVGSLDTQVAQADKVNGQAAELAYVQSVFPDATWDLKTETVDYYFTDPMTANIIAFQLAATPAPDYFLIKNAQRMALFENVDDLAWGVVDVDLLVGQWNLGAGQKDLTISHVSEFQGSGGSSVGVPEPGTLALLAGGLLALRTRQSQRRTG